MAHIQQQQFIASVKSLFPSHFVNCQVLDVGSLDINGSVRSFFENCSVLGIDVGEGPGVDLVCEGQNLDHPDSTYDTITSCECFEHNPHWVETFSNMYRMLKNNGLIIMTCATIGRPEHGTSRSKPEDAPLIQWDYYQNLQEKDFRDRFDIDQMFSEYKFIVNYYVCDLYFYGIKSE